MPTTERMSPAHLADVTIPGAPVVWGERVVYVVQRTDLAAKQSWSSLFAVDRTGGEPHRLTQGDFRDRLPRARAGARGGFVLFASDRGHGDQIYRLDGDGGEARRLTDLPFGKIADLCLSPDGARAVIVFLPAPPEDDALPLAADLARGVLPAELPSSFLGAARSPQREQARERVEPRARVSVRLRNREDGRGWLGGREQLWLVDPESGDARRLTSGERDFCSPAWAPSGHFIVACASRTPTDQADCDGTRNDLVRIELEAGEIQPLVKPDGAVFSPSVSPDGDLVAYVLWQPGDDYGHENATAWLSPIGSGSPRPLTADLDRPVMDMVIDDLAGGIHRADRPLWSADGTSVRLTVSDCGAVRIWEQPIDGGAGRFVSDADHAIGGVAAFDDGELAVALSSRGSFPEIGLLGRDGSLRAITRHNAAVSERCAPRAPERVSIEHDGVRLSGYWYPPRGVPAGARAPALLYIHGGPCVAYGERLFFEMQWLAELGYGVLCPNPRGSQSYGVRYSSAIRGRWGEPDRGDQLAFADWLTARSDVDPERLGLLGGSYGGYMTLLLAATSDRFRTAIAERGLYNWCSLSGSSDFGHCHQRMFGGKWPWEEPERYVVASPIRLVADVRIPTLVVHHEGDLRVGTEQGIQLFNALKLCGVPTALLLFPGEEHGMTRGGRIDRRLERLRQIEAWLEAWLRN
jgi:dipeptidyl aminopeptidase/acylaminoacyl peptidase